MPAKPSKQSQLVMRRPDLTGLPEPAAPTGFRVRSSQAGDAAHWEAIISTAFQDPKMGAGAFARVMMDDPAYRPERIFFVVAPAGQVCATASAYRRPERYGADVGYLHYVGVLPAFGGQRLGQLVSLAALDCCRREGCRAAVLQTDDFRLPAIKTYLRLGFLPELVDEHQAARWQAIFDQLDMPWPGRTEDT